MSEILTPKEVAEKLKLDIKTIWRYLREGKIKSFKVGRYYRILEEDLQKFIEERYKAS